MYGTLKKRSILNRKAEPPKARLGRRRVWASSMLIAFSLCFSKDYSVADKPRTTHYKQYAFIKLNHSFTEFYCLDELYHYESRGIQALATAHTMAYHKVGLHTWHV
jgi:hypothetical protein